MELSLENRTILITGAAGFIGAALTEYLLKHITGIQIVGIDNLNPYYDVSLKETRLSRLKKYKNFRFIKGDIGEKELVMRVFADARPSIVVNLAAQAGVRYSVTNPDIYIESNLGGFFHILEACRYSYENGQKGVEHFVYASSSSVYGSSKKVPYSVKDPVDHPVSLYAATKKFDELIAYTYSRNYGIPSTGLRFFTVYGPEGRPDMAYFKFTEQLVRQEAIPIFNYGDMYRDFTYIEDVVRGTAKVLQKPPQPDEDGVAYKLYNIGNHHPERLLTFVEILETCLMEQGMISCPGEKEFLPMQPGDVYQTYADIKELEQDFGFRPSTSLYDGLTAFTKWYRSSYKKEGAS